MVRKMKCHSISVRGAKQIDAEKPCQDSSSDSLADRYAVIAVSDGHGGDKYFRSDKGSQIAVDVALACVSECFAEQIFIDTFIEEEPLQTNVEKRLIQLIESIVCRWNEAVRSDLEENPIKEDELTDLDNVIQDEIREESADAYIRAFGATLLTAVIGNGFWFGLHIGDGTFVVKHGGEYSQPIPLDELCVGPYTTSICGKDALKHFYTAQGKGTPEAILIASDGVDESFSSVEKLYAFYDTVIKSSHEDWDGNIAELEAYLPKLSEQGSRDDISLAWIVSDMELKENISYS
ncbi:MAG: protein phosphatase 2C domain-containing protein [Oscillospiraceae bacterium]|nr:protein phosphatase 2C domain-containing protein [Oscillospiraceae bacterium]